MPDSLWLLLGAVLATTVLALIVATLAAPAVRALKPSQRRGLLVVSVVTLWAALAGTTNLLERRSLPSPQAPSESESSRGIASPTRPSSSGAISHTEHTAAPAARSVEIFSAPPIATPSLAPIAPTPQPAPSSLQPSQPSIAPGRTPSADEWVQYQDLRGIRAERRIRLGDARFIKKGGRYYVDFGKIAGLPNELEVVAADQEKVRLWLGE